MPIPTVAVDDPILADTMNALIQNANGSPYRAVFTASGSWTIPVGVQKYKVTVAGGGGSGGTTTSTSVGEGEYVTNPGGPGGTAPMISGVFNAGGAGSVVTFTVGAAGVFSGSGNGGSTSCSGLVSGGGNRGGTGGGSGANGAATFPPGFPAVYHFNGLFGKGVGEWYGLGGSANSDGMPGAVIIEW